MDKLKALLLLLGFEQEYTDYYCYQHKNVLHYVEITYKGTIFEVYITLNSLENVRNLNFLCMEYSIDDDLKSIRKIPEFDHLLKHGKRKNIIAKLLTV